MRVSLATALSFSPRTRRAVACLLGGMLLMELAVGLVPVHAAPLATTQVRLQDDDGGAALFGSDGLHPGRIDRACVALSATGLGDPSDEVRLSAEVSNADLAPYLIVTVERGSVGTFGNCASFSGEALWTGTLAQFPSSASTGIGTGWRPGVRNRAIYRFTVTIADDPRAQQRAAAATFVWTLDQADVTPVPEPAAEAAPPVAAPPSEPVAPEPSPTEALPSSPPPPPADERPARTDDVVEAPPLPVGPTSIEEAIERVAETALSVASHGQFPAVLVVVLLAFLALQGAVDRRDPKLALARLHQDLLEFRQFPESSRTETS